MADEWIARKIKQFFNLSPETRQRLARAQVFCSLGGPYFDKYCLDPSAEKDFIRHIRGDQGCPKCREAFRAVLLSVLEL